MAVGIAVLLAQLASRPASVMRIAQLLGVPKRTVANKLRELASSGAVIKEGSYYIANYEVFATADAETAAHINRMKEAVLDACAKLEQLERTSTKSV
jgi:DNA-binding IclR family transcriptional regulator